MMENGDYGYIAAYNTARPTQKPICSNCGKVGHTVAKCYKIHGYPPGYKINANANTTRNVQQFQPRMQMTSYPSQPRMQQLVEAQMQMTQPQMFVPQQQLQMVPYPTAMQTANAAYSENGSYVPMMPHVTSGGNNLNLQDLTQDQIQHLISQFNTQVRLQEPAATSNGASSSTATITEHGLMAQASTSGNIPFPSTSLKYENNDLTFQNLALSSIQKFLASDAWIIDSGASSHVCSNLAMFRELIPVTGVTVTLPNGTRVAITHTRAICITSTFILHNVLLVPDFKFNLISVSCLVKSLSCSAHFFPTCCYIQELSRGLMIGRG